MSDRQVNLTRLRERAERAIAREEAGLAREAGSPAGLELHGLVEELRVYQTELEIQNEELTLAQSQLAQSLERYRLLFDHLPLPALVVDGRGFILEVNRQASDLLNLNRTSFQQRGALFQLFDFASRGPIHFYFRGLVSAGPQILTSLVARLDEDQTLPCDLHLMPLASESPQGGQTLAVLVDRRNELALRDSERRWRELSQDYQLAKQQAESANQAKSAFLATMSHEFRTPMNIILGLTELLLSSETTPRRNNYLRKIQDVARALYGLLNDILDYSRIETGLLTIEAQPLRLYDVLDSTSQLFGHCAEEKGLDLRFEVSPEVPPLLLGDPLRLQQVLNHLVDNALKFTTAGSVRVLITRADPPEAQRGQEKAGVVLRLAVIDTGIGLTPFEQERLFVPFQQGDMSTTRPYGGAGLGLCIAQRLTGLMGGEIGVESVSGVGSTFWFTVPLALPTRSGAAPEASPSSTSPGLALAPASGSSPLGPGVAPTTRADPWSQTSGVTPALNAGATPLAPDIGMRGRADDGARSDSSASRDGALIQAKAKAKVVALARLLEEGSNQARHLSRELEGLLAGLALRDAYAEIAAAINELDYDRAQASLRRFAARHQWPIPGAQG